MDETPPNPMNAFECSSDSAFNLPAMHSMGAASVRPGRRGSRFWAPWLVTIALTIAVVALGVENRALNDELRGESNLVTNLAAKASHAQQVLEVLTSPSAQRVTLTSSPATDKPSGHALYLPDRGGLIFQANNLKALPEGKTYELWMIPANGKSPMPAGLFQPDARGEASLVLPPLPTGVSAKSFGITVENPSGSEAPTTPVLLAGTASGV